MKKQPEQTKITRQKLMDAFWAIYQKKEIGKITIGEITKTAAYNRGTFYEYFTDIYDVLNQLEDELLEAIQNDIRTTFYDGFPTDLSEFSTRCASVFKKYEDKLFLLLGPSGDPKFGVKIQNVFASTFTAISHLSFDIPHFDYVITFIFSSLIGVMTHWYENGKDLSEEEFVHVLQKLVATGVMGYSNIPLFQI